MEPSPAAPGSASIHAMAGAVVAARMRVFAGKSSEVTVNAAARVRAGDAAAPTVKVTSVGPASDCTIIRRTPGAPAGSA